MTCGTCGIEDEDVEHVLRRCTAAKDVWQRLGPPMAADSFLHQLWNINLSCHGQQNGVEWRVMFATATWWLWKWRCEMALGKKGRPGAAIEADFIRKNAAELQSVMHSEERRMGAVYQLEDVRWEKPRLAYKLNVDGCAKGNPGLAGAGGLIRDADGHWVSGFSMNLRLATSILAELMALCEGLKMAENKGIESLEVESDSQLAKYFLRKDHPLRSTLRSWIEECKQLLAQHELYQVRHIFQEANGCADWLANRGISEQMGRSFHVQPPVEL